jgi:hypothetical protein
MPDQPDDPIHYEMKIPPEPKDAALNKEDAQRDGGESHKAEEDSKKDDQFADRHPSPNR